MRRISIAIWAVAILANQSGVAQRPPQSAPHDTQIARDTVISLQRGACERRCAVYKVIIFADGTAVYIGQYFVKTVGVHLLQVPQESIARFVEQAKQTGFFDMHTEYGFDPDKPGCSTLENHDEPISILTISSAGHSHTVTHHHRCSGPEADQLTTLETQVDTLTNSRKWIR